MSWNDPQKDNDPWRGKQPPDLDEALKKFVKKLKQWISQGQSSQTIRPAPGKRSPIRKIGSNNINAIFSFAIGIIFVLWLLSGIFIVEPAEQAAILQFGRYIEIVGPGPHWIPRFIQRKIVVNVDRVSDYSYSAQMLTKDENLVAVSVAVQYRIGDLPEYLFNVTNPRESLQQATSSALRQVVGTTTLDQLITEGREAWGSRLQETLIKILAIYKTGIVVLNVSPQPARAPENVQDAFDDAIKAQEDEKRFKEQARAYEARVVPIAEGNSKRIIAEARAYAEQVVLRAKGETAIFLALLPSYLNSPELTSERLYLDTMEQVLGNSRTVLMENAGTNMVYLPWDKMGAGAVNKDALKNSKSETNSIGSSHDDLDDLNRSANRLSERYGRRDV